MTESLFRKEALEANKSKLIGSVALYCPPYRWLIISIVAFITLTIAVFFIFGSYTQRETAIGELVPIGGVMTVVPPMTGTVIQVSVKEGQPVKKGAPLMVISSEVSTALGGTRAVVAKELRLQRARVETDMEGLAALNAESLNGYTLQAKMLERQLAQLELQRIQRTKQAALSRRQQEKLILMRKEGFASNSQVEQQESAVLEADARLQDIARQRLDMQQQLAQVKQQLRELPLNTRNQQHEMQRKLSDLDRTLAENESQRAIVLRAPEDAVVGALLAAPGQIVGGNQSVVSLLAANGHLQARLMVGSRAIGFIEPNQQVVLRYQAYPYQKFGQQYGRVMEVSRTALSAQEVSNLTGQPNVQEKFYRVTVALDRQDIQVYGRDEQLRPGIALEADFLIDRRRLVEWVLEPLYALGRRSAT